MRPPMENFGITVIYNWKKQLEIEHENGVGATNVTETDEEKNMTWVTFLDKCKLDTVFTIREPGNY